MVDYTADMREQLAAELGKVSRRVFKPYGDSCQRTPHPPN